jgi:DNA-binding phage protein
MNDIPRDEVVVEAFREDPAYAVELLNAILADGERAESLIVLRQMTKAIGRVREVAKEADLNPNQLYHALPTGGDLEPRSLSQISRAMGLRLIAQPIAEFSSFYRQKNYA